MRTLLRGAALFLGVIAIAIVFVGCEKSYPKAPCDTAETGPAARTIQINVLTDCTITTTIGTDIKYDFVSPYRDVRISWTPVGTTMTGVNTGRVLTVSGTVNGEPMTKNVRLWYGTRSTTFTWKVSRR